MLLISNETTRLVRYETCEIIRDVPSITIQRVMKRYLQLIKKAKSQIF